MKATMPAEKGLGGFWDMAHITAIRNERAMIALCRVSGYIAPPCFQAIADTVAGGMVTGGVASGKAGLNIFWL